MFDVTGQREPTEKSKQSEITGGGGEREKKQSLQWQQHFEWTRVGQDCFCQVMAREMDVEVSEMQDSTCVIF